MKVIYSEREYEIKEDIDSGFFDNIKNCTGGDKVNLKLHERSFKLILNGLESIDFENISKKKLFDLYQGLKYFMVSEVFLEKFKEKACSNKSLIRKIKKEIEEYAKDFDTYEICNNENLSSEFFEKAIKNKDFICWDSLCRNSSISDELFEKILKGEFGPKKENELDWWYLTINRSLNFLKKAIKEGRFILWKELCYRNFPVEFFEKLIKERESDINWHYLCRNPNLPVEFFEKAIKEGKPVRWDELCVNSNLPVEFFEKAIKEGKPVDWNNFCYNKNLPVEFFERMLNGEFGILEEGIHINWGLLCINKNLPVEFFERMIKEGKSINWGDLCRNPNIPVEFFEKAIKEGQPVVWYELCKNPNLPVEFFEKAIKEGKPVDWNYLCENPNLPVEFFEKMIKEGKPVKWNYLCKNQNIPIEFFEKAIKEGQPVVWYYLEHNKNFPLSFFKRHGKMPTKNIINSTILYDYFN
jgi:hypothetical protein